MPWPQHDGQRQREQDQQDDERDRDAKPAARLRRVHQRQRDREVLLRGATARKPLEDRRLVHVQGSAVGLQVATHKDVRGEVLVRVLFQPSQHADGDPRELGQLLQRDLTRLALLLQVLAE